MISPIPHQPDNQPDNPPDAAAGAALLTQILSDQPPSFAVLVRPGSRGHRPPGSAGDPPPAADLVAEVMIGDVAELPALSALPIDDPAGPPVLAVVPFRQLAERGFDVIDDGAPLLALTVRARARLPLGDLLRRLPADAGPFTETGYDVPDGVYRDVVAQVLAGEIATGEGSNFVIHRAVTGRVAHPPAQAALGALRHLLTREQHAYWTFAVHTPSATFAGATPERHVSLDGGVVTMNPISGTLRYPAGGWASAAAHREAVLAFLADPKERDELWMVLDEELKMMAHVADLGGRVAGPYLKEMAQLAHTEYVLEGRTGLDAREVLAATMFAPTVTGSPIRNACRVIARHEQRGRGYYGGVLALLDHDEQGRQRLDAPILIRTARIAPDGTVSIPAGATLVRGSQPEAELAETRAKAAAILGAFTASGPGEANVPDHPSGAGSAAPAGGPVDRGAEGMAEDPLVVAALARRNDTLARFWLEQRSEQDPGLHPEPDSERRLERLGRGADERVTVVDAEDDFTAMLAHLLRSLGRRVEVVPWNRVPEEILEQPGLVVLGPGPGDPADLSSERIVVLHAIAATRLAVGRPTLGICLGHQVLGLELGLAVRRLPVPDQGVQAVVSVAGQRRPVGFYNSFVLVPPAVTLDHDPGLDGLDLELDLDDAGGRIVALHGPGVAGLQFHPESVLTSAGAEILAETLARLAAPVTAV